MQVRKYNWTTKAALCELKILSAMSTIRPAQLEAFSQEEVRKFELWVLAHLRRFFPKQCDAAGESQLRETIRYGIERAAVHGLRGRRDVCKYIDVMMLLGRDFDTGERFPWARVILVEIKSPEAKMEALCSAVRNYLRSR